MDLNAPSITRIIMYVKNIHVREEYSQGGCTMALHKAAVSQKSGVAIKTVFGVRDVEALKAMAKELGLKFGSTWKADGIESQIRKTRPATRYLFKTAN